MFLWIALCAPLILAIAIVLALLASSIGKPKPIYARDDERERTARALAFRWRELQGRIGHGRRATRAQQRQMEKLRRLHEMFRDEYLYQRFRVLTDRSRDGILWRVDGAGYYAQVQTICFLVVQCPSTHNDYVLFVPPEMKTVEQARAWTFHMEPPPKKKKERVAAWAFLPARANPNEFNPNVET